MPAARHADSGREILRPDQLAANARDHVVGHCDQDPRCLSAPVVAWHGTLVFDVAVLAIAAEHADGLFVMRFLIDRLRVAAIAIDRLSRARPRELGVERVGIGRHVGHVGRPRCLPAPRDRPAGRVLRCDIGDLSAAISPKAGVAKSVGVLALVSLRT